MGFYSVVPVMFASCAFFACFVTTRSQLATVTPDMLTVKYEDEKWNNITTKSQVRSVSEIAADSKEERAPSANLAAELVADFTAEGRHPVEWNNLMKVIPKSISDKISLPNDDAKKELVQYLVRAFYHTLWKEFEYGPFVRKVRLFHGLSKHFGHDLLAYVLVKLKSSKLFPGHLAKDYHQRYLEWMVREEYSLSDLIKLWKTDGVPLSAVAENLIDFAELSNKQLKTEPHLFQTLKDMFEDEKEFVQLLLSLKREGGEIEKQMLSKIVKSWVGEKSLDEVFDLIRPKSVDGKWSFDTLLEFTNLSGGNTKLLRYRLKEEFGGYDKLAPVLAEAKQYDQAAETLQFRILSYFLEMNYSFEEVVIKLNLQEGNLTPANKDTLEMFAVVYMARNGVRFDWEKKLMDLRAAHRGTKGRSYKMSRDPGTKWTTTIGLESAG